MTTNDSLSRLSDAELLNEVKRLAAIEREATADLIRSLAEVEARRLHLAIGCSSMFGYCTQVLHLSEHAAYARIAAARAATRFPVVMDLLIEGAITLTTVTLLGRHLTAENHAALLESARHKSKADVEMLVATLHPQPDVPSSVRKVPAPKLQAAATAPLISDVTEAIAVPQATTREPPTTPPPPARRRPGHRARALQAASHDRCGDPREAPPGAGPAAAHEPERRRSGSHRPGVDGARRATRKGEVRPNGSTAARGPLRSRLTLCPRASATRGQRTRRRSMRLRRARRPLHRDGRAPVPSPHSVRRWRADDRRQSRVALPGAQRLRSRAVVRAAVRAGDRRRSGACPPKRPARRWASLVWTKFRLGQRAVVTGLRAAMLPLHQGSPIGRLVNSAWRMPSALKHGK